MKIILKASAFVFLIVGSLLNVMASESPLFFEDTWANWEKRLDRAYEGVKGQKLPGQCIGILVPNDPREDLLPLTAIGYETMAMDKLKTIVIFLQAPQNYPLDGLVVPGIDAVETSLGRFVIDSDLRTHLQGGIWQVNVDNNLFTVEIPRILQTQLANLKYVLKNKASSVKILPVYVKLSNPASQVKDYAPFLAELIKDIDRDMEIHFVITANVSRSASIDSLIRRDNTLLNALRNQDVDVLLMPDMDGVSAPDLDSLSLGVLTLRILGADHAEIMGYAHSAQLVLSKDKSVSTSYVTAGFATAPPIRLKQTHIDREKMVETFDELARGDMLSLTRQTCASILDPTAAKPPSLTTREAGKKWPAYVSLYNPEGSLAGQAGSHVAQGPLEESLRTYSLAAVRQAQPTLTKANFQNYVVDVSIPYGFVSVRSPEELIPLLNGVIIHQRLKTSAFHPDAWRTYPDPHQLLSSICVRLGLKPWAYATGQAKLESFRILSFNEKEPFQDLGAAIRKKKKKKSNPAAEEENMDLNDGGGGGGGSPFSF